MLVETAAAVVAVVAAVALAEEEGFAVHAVSAVHAGVAAAVWGWGGVAVPGGVWELAPGAVRGARKAGTSQRAKLILQQTGS